MDMLRGVIERITYHNEENGYTVAKLIPESGPRNLFGLAHEVAIVGNMAGINVGESVELGGQWTIHAEYGKQFQVEQMRSVLPATVAGIEKYLGSGLIKGVGPVTAKRIVRHFGEDTLNIIEQTPERLAEVPGVGQKRTQTDHPSLGGTTGHQRGHALSAKPRCLHRSGHQDLQDLWR